MHSRPSLAILIIVMFLQEIAQPPYVQLWLRYSAFLPLYPLGVASELTMAYLALPIIKAKQPLSVHLPNLFNFGFDYYTVCWAIIVAYLPGKFPSRKQACVGS